MLKRQEYSVIEVNEEGITLKQGDVKITVKPSYNNAIDFTIDKNSYILSNEMCQKLINALTCFTICN